jgi:Fe-S-cluster containining protein
MESLPTLVSLPSAVDARTDGPPCHRCAALCCRYYALEIDAPEDEHDFEQLKWYLIHGKSWIWSDGGEWYLQVDEVCRFLGPQNECTVYDRRPKICRQYGMPEHLEDPEEPLCDYFTHHERHELEFRTLDEIDAFAREFLARQAEQRERRSAAAREGWARRRTARGSR